MSAEPSQIYHTTFDSKKQVRLLLLEPAKHLDEPLVASFEIRNVAAKTVYNALSYTWDPPFDGMVLADNEITISGIPTNIKGNLSHALRRLRKTDAIETLWVDALCINQSDLAERSQQVAMMAEIYEKATEVLIWLGEDTEERDGFFVFSLTHHWIVNGPALEFGPEGGFRKFADRLANEIKGEKNSSGFDKGSRELAANSSPCSGTLVNKLLSRSYFRRRWVVQEVCSSTDARVFCGNSTVDLSNLGFVLKVLAREMFPLPLPQPDHLHSSTKADLLASMHARKTILPLLRLRGRPEAFADMCTFGALECADPRDRIFALCSMWKTIRIEVDYSRSVGDLFLSFARSVLGVPSGRTEVAEGEGQAQGGYGDGVDVEVGRGEGSNGVHLIATAAWQADVRSMSSTTDSPPSWVPDWQLPVPPWDGVDGLVWLSSKWPMATLSDTKHHLNLSLRLFGCVTILERKVVMQPMQDEWWAENEGFAIVENLPPKHDSPYKELAPPSAALRLRVRVGDVVGQPCWEAGSNVYWATLYRPTDLSNPRRHQIVGVLPIKHREDTSTHVHFPSDGDPGKLSTITVV